MVDIDHPDRPDAIRSGTGDAASAMGRYKDAGGRKEDC
jgi:hypothetical protein